MKIPAIRSKIGNWTYYISSFSFLKISEMVKKIDNELHTSKTLSDQIQRSITDNYKNVKKYIVNQEDRFFNSLVLAVYDGYPKWIEIELKYEDEDFYNMGFLEFNGTEKIFPVDGQHRVEGIKAALIEKPELSKEEISVILIGHQNNEEGMKRTRRLFTTLNRYARPVKLNDIIALDEDDSIAIITRDLLENFPLFTSSRINNAEQKAIPESDKDAFTSLITLYECNTEIYKNFIRLRTGSNPTKIVLLEKLKFRPNDDELLDFQNYVIDFWTELMNNYDPIKTFLINNIEPAKQFRNNSDGGNLLFRPIGLLPFVQTVFEINNKTSETFENIIKKFNEINLTINQKPWTSVLWNPIENLMIMGNRPLVKMLLKYLYDESILTTNELQKLKEKYLAATNPEGDIINALEGIK